MEENFMTTKGYFGQFGGSFVPEPIQALLDELEVTFDKYKDDPEFLAEYRHYLKDYSGRETPLYFAESLTDYLGGAKIYLKREDLNHTGAHKINNALGQVLLAKRMGKKKIIAETGVKIDIDEEGNVSIYSSDQDAINRAKEIITALVREAKVDEVYHAKVVRIEKFGAFVNLFDKTDALVHISEMALSNLAKK